ncbi:MAG: class I SAM-dependent methyltransferase, partial [Phycisphaerales bacterium]
MRPEKQLVRDFYDVYGWEKSADGAYKDTSTFVDRRPVLDGYRHRTHMRVSKFLPTQGEYFLDAGCGAIPHPEYLEYSRGYRYRVCVDLSERALKEARAKLRDQGLYVVADVTNLPFAEHTIDGAVSAHVLYHVPYDEQEAGIRELYRTLARGRAGVIIYTWPDYWHSWLRRRFVWLCILFGRLPGVRGAWNVIRMIAGKRGQAPGNEQHTTRSERPPLYFRPHDRRWFRQTFGAK